MSTHEDVAARPRAARDRRVTDIGALAVRTPAPAQADPALRLEVLRRAQLFRHALIAADLLAALLAVLLVPVGGVLAVPLVVLAAKLGGLYERDEVVLNRSTLDEVPQLFRLAVLTAPLLWLAGDRAGGWKLATLTAAFLVLVVALRAAARTIATAVAPVERCLLVGDLTVRERLDGKLHPRKATIVGELPLADRRVHPARTRTERPHAVGALAGPAAALDAVVAQRRVHRILVAPGPQADSEVTLAVISRAKELGAQVSILPRLFEVVGSSVEFDHVDGLVMLGVHQFGLSRSSRMVKRAMDLAFAVAALTAVAPLMAAIAVAIKLESPGPVLFRQRRVGREGTTFGMLKFRSMVDGADQARAELAALRGTGAELFKLPDDPRVTRVGRVIRRFSLDELPQLINVLKGEMSLVGPRPLVLDEDRRVEGWHRRRLHLTPGMTGPWQVLGDPQHRVPLREMVTIDYLYAANWSLWTDVKVVLRTAGHVLGGRGI